MRFHSYGKNKKGFTLMETLGAVAIIVILLAVSFIAGSKMISSMKQKKLDTIAEDIYVTAQERLTRMYLEGSTDALNYQSGNGGMASVTAKPADWTLNSNDVAFTSLTALYNNKSGGVSDKLLPSDSLNAEVYGANWIIEYNPEYGYIYGVFYSEKPFKAADGSDIGSLADWYSADEGSSSLADAYRSSYDTRKAAGVGYYGGIGVVAGKVVMTATSLNVTLDIVNAEELHAKLAVKVPSQYKDKLVRVTLTFTEIGNPDHKSTYDLDLGTTGSNPYGYYNREETIILDSLADVTNNTKDFRSRKSATVNQFLKDMTPGADVSVTATARLSTDVSSFTENTECDIAEATAEFNSLFEKVSGTTAYVAYGRHLQNLGKVSTITNVIQTSNIDFEATNDDFKSESYKENDISTYDINYWAETYCGKSDFTPVNGSAIVSYDGGKKLINGMTVSAGSGNAGIFSALGADEKTVAVKDLSIVGTMINGSPANSGALAGETAGTVTLSGVGAYLALDDFYGKLYSEATTTHLDGNTVGGLVGKANGNISAEGCFSAQVLRGSGSEAKVGGLFGSVSGSMIIKSSYTDNYMCGDGGSIGGFAASCGNGSSINGCYTAGFTTGTPKVSAGFVPSRCDASNSYTVLHIGETTHTSTAYHATVSDGTISYVYYATPEEEEGTYKFTSQLGTETPYANLRAAKAPTSTSLLAAAYNFESGTGNTTAYNMDDGLGLTKYPYPLIKFGDSVLHHYGDWTGSLFNPGTLVYFEIYSDGTAGFAGAGNSFLQRNKTIVRDGYALLYSKKYFDNGYGKTDSTLTYNGNYTTTVAGLNASSPSYNVVKTNGKTGTYYFRELPYDLLNANTSATLFGTGAVKSADGFYAYMKVETPDTTALENNGVSHYFFNPNFASTVIEVESDSDKPSLAVDGSNIINIRTARQFYLLSANYDALHGGYLITSNNAAGKLVYPTLSQDMDIDYESYQWTNCGFTAKISAQKPISDYGVNNKFNVTYNGNCHILTGFSIESTTAYTGLFGRIARNGKLLNIVYAAEASKNLSVGYKDGFSPSTAGQPAYLGILAAYNEGVIDNCAVAGFKLNISTYNGSTTYAGGLCGYNNKQISSCSADIPQFTVNTNRSNGYIGGFVGFNNNGTDEAGVSVRGTVSQCYALTAINVTRWTSGTVRVAGFAGTNAGLIEKSYTICSIELSNIGENYVDGFTFAGGSVDRSTCLYLTSGTYRYAGTIYPYTQSSATAKAAKSRNALPNYAEGTVTLEGFGTAAYSYLHSETTAKGGTYYPFGSSVKNSAGAYVHYGDWISDDVLGNIGMVYWEHEENGSNNGYHFYIRYGTRETDVQSTLCTAHDDGGVITEYGYGWYYLKDENVISSPSISFSGVYTNANDRNANAQKAINAQFSDGYEFVLYNTADAFNSSKSGLYINGANAWATATLKYKEKSGDAFKDITASYSFSPFFGAAIKSGTDAPTQLQIRSVSQLQFLNYRRGNSTTGGAYARGTTNETVKSGNHTSFIYLGQYNTNNTSVVSKTNALNRNVFDWTWSQSHDIKLPSSVTNFTPIAGAGSSSSSNSYNAVLYAWFGSTYDGNSYKIEDIKISSDCFTVGLFGVTAGATMKNIIMYSETDSVIERYAANNSTSGAYSLGGMIGVVYDYDGENVKIENCAIAGYRIIDNSENKQTLGEANVGGLVGVCNGYINKCSSVVDIEINCTHKDSNGNYTQAKYGNYIRVGGIAGAVLREVSQCYSGGSISVGADTLKENLEYFDYDSKKFVADTDNKRVAFTGSLDGTPKNVSTSVFVAGIGGSGFAQNYKNFSGNSGFREGSPEFSKCYTYMEFPRIQGTVRGISIIGSIADRYGQSPTVKITDCYYLDSIATAEKLLPSSNMKFYYNNSLSNTTIKAVLESKVPGRDVTYFEKMLDGSSVAINKLFYNSDYTEKVNGTISLTKLTLPELKQLQLTGFNNVTVTENNTTINGKYSFPAGDTSLQGENYPYPAVVTQKSDVAFDSDGNKETVYVHYGSWPKGTGLFSSKGVINLDLLTQSPDASGKVVNKDSETITISHYSNFVLGTLENSDIEISYTELDESGRLISHTGSSAYVAVSSISRSSDGKSLDLAIKGLKAGESVITVTCKLAGHTETIDISVTVEAMFGLEITPVIKTTASDGTVTFTPVADEDYVPEAYQWDIMESDKDNIYWRLTAVNENSTADAQGNKAVIEGMKAGNWSVSASSVDENYDGYEIISVNNQVYLKFHSTKPGVHAPVVMAANIPGVSGQVVNGTRYADLKCVIKQNPPTVYVYPFPYGTDAELNKLQTALYLITEGESSFYAKEKDGTSRLEGNKLLPVGIDAAKAAGYDKFDGYFTRTEKYGTVTELEFTNKDSNVITYSNKSFDLINVYGHWSLIDYNIKYVLSEEAADNGIKLPDGRNAEEKYNVKSEIALPTPVLEGFTGSPVEYTVKDSEGKIIKTMVFCGWKLSSCIEDGGWTKDTVYETAEDFNIEAGKRGDVEFTAIWNEKCTISYYDGTKKYDGKDTTYVAHSHSISLFVPEDDINENRIFIGWKLKQEGTGITGWNTTAVYKENVITETEGFAGSVELEAVWDEAYYITYSLGVTDADGNVTSTLTAKAKYPKSNNFNLNSVTDFAEFSGAKYLGEIPVELAFRGWKLAENTTGNEAWAAFGTSVIPAGKEITNTASAYTGDITLSAVLGDDFTLKYDLGYTPAEGTDVSAYSDVAYTYTTGEITIPAAPERKGYTFKGWTVTASEEGGSTGNWGASVSSETKYSKKYGNVTIKAVWELKEYKIYFDDADVNGTRTKDYTLGVNPASSVSYVTYTIESGVTLPTPSKDGYRFNGWKQASEADHNVNSEWPTTGLFGKDNQKLEGITGDVYLIATFVPRNSRITYKINNKVFSVQEYENGSVTIAALPTDWYTINGSTWKVEETSDESWTVNSNITAGSTQTNKKGDVTLSASGAIKEFTVRYYTVTNNVLTELTALKQSYSFETESLTLAAIPSETGIQYGTTWKVYETSGNWTAGSTYDPGQELTSIPCGGSNDIKLVVDKNEIIYYIYYKTQVLKTDRTERETVNYRDPVTYTKSSSFKIEDLPKRDGYTITGWTITKNGDSNWGETVEGGKTLNNMYGNVTLTCTKQPIEYTINYIGGIRNSQEKYTADTDITIEPVNDTYYTNTNLYAYFGSWNVAAEVGDWKGSYTAGNNIGTGHYGDVTLNGNFSTKSITFNPGRGTMATTVFNVKNGYSGTAFGDIFYVTDTDNYTAPTVTGKWELEGWYGTINNKYTKIFDVDASSGNLSLAEGITLDNLTTAMANNLNVYAHYRLPLKLTASKNVDDSVYVLEKTTDSIPSRDLVNYVNPTSENYTFLGWATNNNAHDDVASNNDTLENTLINAAIESDTILDLVAKWQRPSSVSFSDRKSISNNMSDVLIGFEQSNTKYFLFMSNGALSVVSEKTLTIENLSGAQWTIDNGTVKNNTPGNYYINITGANNGSRSITISDSGSTAWNFGNKNIYYSGQHNTYYWNMQKEGLSLKNNNNKINSLYFYTATVTGGTPIYD